MSRKQIAAFILLGILITAAVGFFPVIADTTVENSVPLTTLDKQTQLVDLLKTAQMSNDNIFLGIHGYDHQCPLDGSTIYELSSPYGTVPISEIDWRTSAGIEIFNRSGLRIDFYAFPGEVYDQRSIDVLKQKGFSVVTYGMGGDTRHMPVMDALANFTFSSDFREFTWEWRNGVSESEFRNAFDSIDIYAPVEILTHIEDVTNQSIELFQYSVTYGNTKVIRCDDVAFNADVAKTQALVSFAEENDVTLLLAIIPAVREMPVTSLSPFISSTWYMFLGMFVLPMGITVPMAVWFKFNRKIGASAKYLPSVSMILPAYNEEAIIGRSLEQAINQDYAGRLEVIVIDDGSTDRTQEIVRAFIEKHPSVRLIVQPKNMGKPAALNTGFVAATGEISIFQDTDSEVALNLVSLMVPHFADPKVGMVAGMIVIENEKKNLLTKLQQIEYLVSQTIVRFCQAAHQGVLICPGAATAVRTQIARDIPSTDRTITEDADFSLEVAKAGWKSENTPAPMDTATSGPAQAPSNRSLNTQALMETSTMTN